METKGVASVRSPVCNLRQASEAVTHESFVEHVIKEFRREYDLAEDTPIQHIDETPEMAGMEYFRKGIQELQVKKKIKVNYF
jgi:lipoate-protein ligase A